jgi:hypothetical protein
MSTQKYHFSPKTGKVAICNADKRKCRYTQHYDSAQDAASNIVGNRLSPENIEGIVKPPIMVEPIGLKEPERVNYPDAEYDYDSYSTAEDYYSNDYYNSNDDDPYNNYNVYDNLRLTSVDPEATIYSMFRANSRVPLPNEIKQLIKENKWDEVDSWEIHAESDYYGETAVIVAPDNMLTKVQEWYWNQPNAEDNEGILNYVRSKGTETKGLKPLDAIKKQLSEENEGRSNRLVEKARSVTKQTVRLDRIRVPHQNRLDTVNPRVPASTLNHNPAIAGVLIKEGRNYRLIDGYHRLKFYQNANRVNAKYIVLS